MFIERMLAGTYDKESFDRDCWELEKSIVASSSMVIPAGITLISYNVGAFGKYKDSLQEVAQFIREEGASYVALQELDSCNRRHNVFQLSLLADALGYDGHFASAFPFAGGAYGNGAISAKPVLKSYSVPLPKFEGSEPRSIAVIETEEMVFASTHLDFRASSKEQAVVLNDWFASHFSGYGKPVILCGDMNSRPGSETIAELEKLWEQLSGADFTYSTEAPRKCIDYIFHLNGSAPVTVVSADVITSGVSELSDHLPVKVTLTL
jgi:endonuclease/exonuclease/phosphatase family metal-dependent hydrolase